MGTDLADPQEWTHRTYNRAVARTVQALRDMADRIEREAVVAPTDPQSPAGTSPYGWAARGVVHAVMWGTANANIDAVVSAAAEADREWVGAALLAAGRGVSGE